MWGMLERTRHSVCVTVVVVGTILSLFVHIVSIIATLGFLFGGIGVAKQSKQLI